VSGWPTGTTLACHMAGPTLVVTGGFVSNYAGQDVLVWQVSQLVNPGWGGTLSITCTIRKASTTFYSDSYTLTISPAPMDCLLSASPTTVAS
jgi:hypothetical protein